MFKKRSKAKNSAVRKRTTEDDDGDNNVGSSCNNESGSVLASIQRTQKKQKLLASLPVATGRGAISKAFSQTPDANQGSSSNNNGNASELSVLGKKHQEAMEDFIEKQMGTNHAAQQDAQTAKKTTTVSFQDAEAQLYQELASQVTTTPPDHVLKSNRGNSNSRSQGNGADADEGSSAVLVGGNTGIAEVALPMSVRHQSATKAAKAASAAAKTYDGSEATTSNKSDDAMRRLRRHRFGNTDASSSAIPSLSSDTSKPFVMNTGSLLPTKFVATSSNIAQSRGMSSRMAAAAADAAMESMEGTGFAKAEPVQAAVVPDADADRVGFQALISGGTSSRGNSDGNKDKNGKGDHQSDSRGNQNGDGKRKSNYVSRNNRDDQAFRKFVTRQREQRHR